MGCRSCQQPLSRAGGRYGVLASWASSILKSLTTWHARIDRWRTTSAIQWWHRWHELDTTGCPVRSTHHEKGRV